MELAGYLLSLLIGLSLGMIGGGGSVLTIPILVYFFKIEPVLATGYSLLIVGATSAAASVQKWKRREVNVRVAITFGIPSLLTVFLIRTFIIPVLPEIIEVTDSINIYTGKLMLVLFSLLMISAAIGMLKPQKIERPVLPETQGLVLLGVTVGFVSGLLGAGGGFIIIPALIFYASLDIKVAVGTSLVIIALNSLIGFTGDLSHHPINWATLLNITILSITGTFMGNWLSGTLPSKNIKIIFAVFILGTGIVMLLKESLI